ncbi:MAG: hypothetical protein K9J85_07980 [Desulfobacteraceae bacterium]|nr:hypothetical protein [Desulfobacteraceae bacterium]
MGQQAPKKKKGCLGGCLTVIVIVIVIVAGLAVFGYLNRHRIMPFITEKTGIEVSTAIKYIGTKAETGIPSEFMDRAYKIEIPGEDKTVKVTTSDAPVDRTYDIFIQHYRKRGWEVSKEVEALQTAPEQMEPVAGYIRDNTKIAELEKDGRKMGLAVGGFNEETVAAVWDLQDAGTAESGSASSENVKTEDAAPEPKEVPGSDPQDVPLYPGSVRTSYKKATRKGTVFYQASYAVKADEAEVQDFYEKQIEEEGWNIVSKTETDKERYLEADRGDDKLGIVIKPSNDYPDYTATEISAKYADKQ